MNGRLSILLPLTLLTLIAGAAFWLEQESRHSSTVVPAAPRHDPDTIVRNFSAARMDESGMPDFTLSAEQMLHYPDDESTHLEAPRLSHFEPNEPPIHVRSDEGTVSKDGEHVYLKNDVHVTREAQGEQSKLTVTTDYLHVIPDKNVAKTTAPVMIRNDELHITAVGMELNSETRQLELLSKVQGRYEARKPK